MVLNGDVVLGQIDALEGVVIQAVGAEAKTIQLPSGGSLVITAAASV